MTDDPSRGAAGADRDAGRNTTHLPGSAPRLGSPAPVARANADEERIRAIVAQISPRHTSQKPNEALLMAFVAEIRRDERKRTAAALAAADRIQVPSEPEAAPTADGEPARNDLVRAAVAWAEHMDQWTKFQFPTKFGNVFVTLSRMTTFPGEFTPVTPNDTRPAEKPDFPPWSQPMSDALTHLLRREWARCMNEGRTVDADLTVNVMTSAVLPLFPRETPDAG